VRMTAVQPTRIIIHRSQVLPCAIKHPLCRLCYYMPPKMCCDLAEMTQPSLFPDGIPHTTYTVPPHNSAPLPRIPHAATCWQHRLAFRAPSSASSRTSSASARKTASSTIRHRTCEPPSCILVVHVSYPPPPPGEFFIAGDEDVCYCKNSHCSCTSK